MKCVRLGEGGLGIGNDANTMVAFTRDFNNSSKSNKQVTYAFSIPNVWGTIDKLVEEILQLCASRALCASAREIV